MEIGPRLRNVGRRWIMQKYTTRLSVWHIIQLSLSLRWRHMMTSSNGNIFRVTGPLCGEFTGPGEFPTQRPVTWSFDVLFGLRLNKRLSKQPWGWWFETQSWSLWRQCNDNERDGVSNHQSHECLLNRLFRRRSKGTSKLCVTDLCAGNSPVNGEFPAQRSSNAKNVSIWWPHHKIWICPTGQSCCYYM